MQKKILLPTITLLLLSTTSYSTLASFTPINNAKIIHGRSATLNNLIQAGNRNAGATTRAAVTTGGRFAVATLNPRSALGLAMQVARSNPYALAGMAATIYFQDEINQWFAPPLLTGEKPSYPPITKPIDMYSYQGATPQGQYVDLGESEFTTESAIAFAEEIVERVIECNVLQNPQGEGQITVRCTKYFTYQGQDAQTAQDVAVYVTHLGTFEKPECPPDQQPSFILPVLSQDGSTIDKCEDPMLNVDYERSEATFDDMVEPYADDLMQWHNTSIDALQNFEPDYSLPYDPQLTPYMDIATGQIEPEYISSYNLPSVSDQTNELMIRVASGDYQTSNPQAANYITPQMEQQIQSAISSTYANQPFVDPYTSTVVSPTQKTEGAATQAPSPVGSASDPINVTGNFNVDVNVEIPEDDTISQTEYEQSNEKFFSQFGSEASNQQANIDSSVDDLKLQDSDFIDSLMPDITGFSVPDFPTLASIWPNFTTGVCIPLTLNASVASLQQTITFDAHCPPYNTYIHPLLVWLLYMSTGLYIFHLANETIGRK